MSLARLLEPRSVALVGASADPKKISGFMVDFLHRSGFAGRVYPVNPRYESIHEWRCYPSVEALPETVDIVVIAVPVVSAFESLEQAARRGVPFVVLMTGGFGEGTSGAEGARRRERLTALCAETGMRVVGPNTVGMVNFRARLPLTFADWYGRDTGQRGGVAILTHSGSVGGLIFSSLQQHKVGVDYWIAAGNEANLEIADFIEELSGDPALHTIACFMEGVMDGRKFMAAVTKARRAGKHVVVLKAGSSEASLRSTEAHTVKHSSGPDVYRGVLAQLGVVQVRSLQELTYCVKLLASVGEKSYGNLGILSASGGACSLIADHVVHAGLRLPELGPDIQRELSGSIPEYGSARNPVDLSADVVSRRQIIDGAFATLARDRSVDTWLVFGRPVIDRYHAEICAFARETGKAVIVSSGVALHPDVEGALQQGQVAVLDDPDTCMRALGAMHRAAPGVDNAGRDWQSTRPRTPGELIPSEKSKRLLDRHPLLQSAQGGNGVSTRPTPDLVVAIRQDADFGPLLTLQRGRSAARDAGRIVRALPVIERDLADAVAELSPTAGEPIPEFVDRLFGISNAVCKLYTSEPGVAEVVIELEEQPRGMAVTRTVLVATGRSQ
jgi:acyl-CoA synthetase (NDP forming)